MHVCTCSMYIQGWFRTCSHCGDMFRTPDAKRTTTCIVIPPAQRVRAEQACQMSIEVGGIEVLTAIFSEASGEPNPI